MLDIGFQELILIFAVAVMVFGPHKLPELSRNLAKGIGQLRKALFDVKHEINKEMRILDEESGGNAGSFMEEIPKWKKEAMDAIYGGKEPRMGGAKGPGGVNPPEQDRPKDEDTGGEGPVKADTHAHDQKGEQDSGSTHPGAKGPGEDRE